MRATAGIAVVVSGALSLVIVLVVDDAIIRSLVAAVWLAVALVALRRPKAGGDGRRDTALTCPACGFVTARRMPDCPSCGARIL